MNDLSQRILESVNIGIAFFDTYGKLSYINPAAEEILQESYRSFAGKHYRAIFRGSHGATRIIRKTFDDGTPVAGFDLELRKTKNTKGEGSLRVMLGSSPFIGEEVVPCKLVLYIKPSEILSLMGRKEEEALGSDGVRLIQRESRLLFYTTKPKGTGPGLAMARQAIERHGGKLEIKSHPEEGTTVKISLPVDPGRKSAR